MENEAKDPIFIGHELVPSVLENELDCAVFYVPSNTV